MAQSMEVTCEIRYHLDLGKLNEFEAYARAWVGLVERHGGVHLGYFLPREVPYGVRISFPGVGRDGPPDVGVAMFTFPDEDAYMLYRERVSADADCQAAEALFRDTGCFKTYERLFLRPLRMA